MDLRSKSYPSVVQRSPPPATLPSAEDTKSAAAQPPLYLRRGKCSGVGGCAAGLLRSRGETLSRGSCRGLVEVRAEVRAEACAEPCAGCRYADVQTCRGSYGRSIAETFVETIV